MFKFRWIGSTAFIQVSSTSCLKVLWWGQNQLILCVSVIKCRSLSIACVIIKLFLFRVKRVLLRRTENPICINELTSAQRSVTFGIGTRNK